MKEEFVLLIFYSFLVGGSSISGSMLDKYMQKPGSMYHGRYTRDIHEPELLIPRRVFEDGSFHTYSLPKFYDRQELSERKKRSIGEDKLHLVLPFNGVDHHVELIPHHEFISPDMVVETRGGSLNDGVRFKRIPDQQCHYTGFIRDHDNSKAALSLCDGVAGYVQTDEARYFIEPLSDAQPEEDGQHVHMVYKRQAPHEKESESKVSNGRHCGTDNDWESAWAEQLAKRQQLVENNPLALKRADSKETAFSGTHSIHRYIELGIIADRRFLDYHNNTNYEQYLLTIMNMVSDYYHDSSSGNQIDIVVVRMIYLEKEKEELDLKISPKAEGTLASFAAWAYKMNPKDFDHPNHHDIGVLVTRYDICAEDSGCDLLGLAYVAAACDPPKAACINEDSGLLLGIVITHEVGHVMGCSHDDEKISGCKSQDKDESYFVMSPIVFIYTIRWSPCSRKFITNLLETGLGECLNDDPRNPPEKYKFPNMLPGAMYDSDFQCNLDFPGSKFCDKGNICEILWCKETKKCASKGAPPADGTKCGENKWCIRKKCVEMGSRPAAVHGGWGDWGKMSECSRTCGGGVKFSERECDKPTPANGGRYCLGERKKLSMCNTMPCDEKQPSFRAVQCAEYNENSVLADGAHDWKPYLERPEEMCVLYCINEKRTYVKLSPMVKDGTPCKAGTNYVCVSGACRKVGCDWMVDSDAIEDQCGVCKGDGTQCSLVEGEFNKTKLSGYNKIVTIPKGSRGIQVQEVKECKNTIALKLEKEDTYCLNGNKVEQRNGEYPCAGSIAIYSHPEPKREEIEIKGPLTEDIDVQYAFYSPTENPGVHYKYYVKSTNSSYTPKYLWDFVEWSECSADCSGGTMLSEPTCIEQQAGKVSSNFCQGISRPEPKTRTCNEQPCKTKWRVSQWSKCSACGGKKGVRRRKVQCVKAAAHPGGDDVQSNLDACKGVVPRQSENCTGIRPCRKMCNKKTRESENKKNDRRLADDRTISLDEQRRMIDKIVDINMARYLDKPFVYPGRGSKSKRRNIADDFRHLLHDWVVSNDKYKRTCENGTSEKSKIPKYTTPKPGSIVKDVVPPSQIILLEAPFRDELLKSNLSDRAFQEEGDAMPIGIDTKKEKIYTGAEAAKLIKELSQHESSDQQSETTTANGTTLHDVQNKLGNVSSTTAMPKT